MAPPKQTTVLIADEQIEDIVAKTAARVAAIWNERNDQVDKELNDLKEQDNEILKKMDANEQNSRLENLRFFGVKESPNEDINAVVVQVAKTMKVKIDVKEIGRAHRLGKKSPDSERPIIVKFVSYATRKKIFEKKKELKGSGISVAEDLTQIRQGILKAAKEKFSKENVWTQSGVIIVKLNGTYHRATTMDELEDISE